jgi:hypothetical protein
MKTFQIFNDEVDAYKSWALFLIFISILVLISGVVLLTHKKPEPVATKIKSTTLPRRRTKSNSSKTKLGNGERDEEGDEEDGEGGEDQVLWAVGEASDGEDDFGEDEDVDHHQHPSYQQEEAEQKARAARTSQDQGKASGEGEELMRLERPMDRSRDDGALESLR